MTIGISSKTLSDYDAHLAFNTATAFLRKSDLANYLIDQLEQQHVKLNVEVSTDPALANQDVSNNGAIVWAMRMRPGHGSMKKYSVPTISKTWWPANSAICHCPMSKTGNACSSAIEGYGITLWERAGSLPLAGVRTAKLHTRDGCWWSPPARCSSSLWAR